MKSLRKKKNQELAKRTYDLQLMINKISKNFDGFGV